MELSREEQLVALGSALYLVGIEVEASRERLEKLCGEGIGLSDPQVIEANAEFNRFAREFTRLEEQYLRLKDKK